MSLRTEKILRSLDRAYTGPICSVKDWDVKVIPQTIMAKLKKYGLAKTCDMENPINCDDELADQFYKAGYELALESACSMWILKESSRSKRMSCWIPCAISPQQ